MRKTKIFFKVACMFLLVFFYVENAQAQAKTKKEREEIKEEIRHWSFDAVTSAMTYDHENFHENIENNMHFFTQKGCKKFLYILNTYGLSNDVIEQKKSLVTDELWKKNVILNGNKQIVVTEITKDNSNELDNLVDLYGEFFEGWEVSLPLILKISKNNFERRYRFTANFSVMRVEGDEDSFLIYNWYRQDDDLGIPLINSGKKYKKSMYPICDNADVSDVKYGQRN